MMLVQDMMHCIELISNITVTLSEKAAGLDLSVSDLTILSSCRTDKMSYHIVVPKMVFNRHDTSMTFFAFELAMRIRAITEALIQSISVDTLEPYVVAMLVLNQDNSWAYPIDLATIN